MDKDFNDYVTRNPMSSYGQMAEQLDEQRREIARRNAQATSNYWAARNRKKKTAAATAQPGHDITYKARSTTTWSVEETTAAIFCGLFIWGGIATMENWLAGAFIGLILGALATFLFFFLLKLLGWFLRLGLIILGLYLGYLFLSSFF